MGWPWQMLQLGWVFLWVPWGRAAGSTVPPTGEGRILPS